MVKKFRDSVERGLYDNPRTQPSQPGTPPSSPGTVGASDPSGLYFLPCLAEILGDKVQLVARGRKYDLYLIAGWLYTVFVTAVVFAFDYLPLQKIGSSHFKLAQGAGFWAFLGFSLGTLTPARVSPITPEEQYGRSSVLL